MLALKFLAVLIRFLSIYLVFSFSQLKASADETSESSCPVESSVPFQVLSWKPRIMLAKGFLTEQDLSRLIEISSSEFVSSEAYGSHGRKSQTYWIDREVEHTDPILHSLVNRIHHFAMIPVEYGEPLQLAKYGTGEKYEFHHDTDYRMARVATFLGYVRTPESGGWTIFPLVNGSNTQSTSLPPPLDPFHLENGVQAMQDYCNSDQFLRIKPERGDAILFFSMLPSLRIDEMAWHGSCPVVSGEKLVIQRWIKYNADPRYYSRQSWQE